MSCLKDLGLIEFIIWQKKICLNLTNQLTVNNGFEIWSYRGLVCFSSAQQTARDHDLFSSALQVERGVPSDKPKTSSNYEESYEPKYYTKFSYILRMNSHILLSKLTQTRTQNWKITSLATELTN